MESETAATCRQNPLSLRNRVIRASSARYSDVVLPRLPCSTGYGGAIFGAVPFTNPDEAVQSVLLEDLDASVGSGPEVPEDEIAVCYDSDEALLAAIEQRRNARASD